jgi:hypothetical protein
MRARSTLAALMFAGLALTVPAMAAEPAGLVNVPLDVDVYDQPGGVGEPRKQHLKGGSEVNLLEQRADHWCNVAGDSVPGGPGWIWCGMGDDGKDYSLTPVAADTPPPADMGGDTNGAGGGGGEAAEPMKYDCKTIGPNEAAGGGSNDPKITYKCTDIGDGKEECCFYKQP